MSAVEFAGLGAAEFAVGSVFGARAFKVDALGRLTGVTYEQVWRPGENRAVCRKDESTDRLFQYIVPDYYDYVIGGRRIKHTQKPAEPLQHSRATCKCGFYGYYDGSNDYHDKTRVSGVIEAYGDVLIGTRGFRAEKARIVALRIPKGVDDRLAALVRRNYADVPFFPTFSAMVAEFPPSGGGHEFSPESDPEFWDRKL